VKLLNMDEATFRAHYRHTPLWRAKRRGVIRNACLVLGNQGYRPAIAALEKLLGDRESIIQSAARWALEKLR
jgi:epoxyqueuosine reductase